MLKINAVNLNPNPTDTGSNFVIMVDTESTLNQYQDLALFTYEQLSTKTTGQLEIGLPEY